jgi:hypothetical protein
VIQADSFVLDTAKDHAADLAIANREGREPLGGGFVVPEPAIGFNGR